MDVASSSFLRRTDQEVRERWPSIGKGAVSRGEPGPKLTCLFVSSCQDDKGMEQRKEMAMAPQGWVVEGKLDADAKYTVIWTQVTADAAVR